MGVHEFARGAIRNRSRKRQCVDMTGLKIGNITPTDLDGLIDYHNEAFAFFELKLRNTPIEYGQKTALIRVVDALTLGGKRAALFLASHTIDNPYEDIPADRCRVRMVYELQQWREPEAPQTLREAIDLFLGFGPAVETFVPYEATQLVDDAILRDPVYVKEMTEWLARTKAAEAQKRDREPGEEG